MFFVQHHSEEWYCTLQTMPHIERLRYAEITINLRKLNGLIINNLKNEVMLTILEVALLIAIIVVPLAHSKSSRIK